MRNISLPLLIGTLALGLSGCGGGTTTPGGTGGGGVTGGGPVISDSQYRAVTGKAGENITIVSYGFDRTVSSINGSPVFVFSGRKAGATTAQRTAPCALAEQRLVCSYTVLPADVGEASEGITFNSTPNSPSGFQPKGASTVGTDGKSASLSYSSSDSGISTPNFIIGSVKF